MPRGQCEFQLSTILEDLAAGEGPIAKAGGAHLVELVEIGIGQRADGDG